MGEATGLTPWGPGEVDWAPERGSGRGSAKGSEAVTEAAFRADATPGAGRGFQDPQKLGGRVAAEPLCRSEPRDAAAHHQHPPAARGLRAVAA